VATLLIVYLSLVPILVGVMTSRSIPKWLHDGWPRVWTSVWVLLALLCIPAGLEIHWLSDAAMTSLQADLTGCRTDSQESTKVCRRIAEELRQASAAGPTPHMPIAVRDLLDQTEALTNELEQWADARAAGKRYGFMALIPEMEREQAAAYERATLQEFRSRFVPRLRQLSDQMRDHGIVDPDLDGIVDDVKRGTESTAQTAATILASMNMKLSQTDRREREEEAQRQRGSGDARPHMRSVRRNRVRGQASTSRRLPAARGPTAGSAGCRSAPTLDRAGRSTRSRRGRLA
jgi:hypothetical protein